MIPFHSKRYHHPRWPLVKNTISCALWILIGTGILVSPIGLFRWIGLALLAHGFGRWIFSIRPRWKHVIFLEEGKLKIGDQSYEWDQFERMEIERKESHRSIRLTGEDDKIDIRIKDDLSGFDELSSGCFYHINRAVNSEKNTPKEPSSADTPNLPIR